MYMDPIEDAPIKIRILCVVNQVCNCNKWSGYSSPITGWKWIEGSFKTGLGCDLSFDFVLFKVNGQPDMELSSYSGRLGDAKWIESDRASRPFRDCSI